MRGFETVLKPLEFTPFSLLTSFDVENFFWNASKQKSVKQMKMTAELFIMCDCVC